LEVPSGELGSEKPDGTARLTRTKCHLIITQPKSDPIATNLDWRETGESGERGFPEASGQPKNWGAGDLVLTRGACCSINKNQHAAAEGEGEVSRQR